MSMGEAKYNAEEIAFLAGAKVAKVEASTMDLGGYTEDVVQITFTLGKPINVEGKLCKSVTYEVWQDPEGNGPGHLALVGSA